MDNNQTLTKTYGVERKHLRIIMNDGSQWEVPLGHIIHCLAHNKAIAYFDYGTEGFQAVYHAAVFELHKSDDSLLALFLHKRLKWDDLREHAVRINEPDYVALWEQAQVEIVQGVKP